MAPVARCGTTLLTPLLLAQLCPALSSRHQGSPVQSGMMYSNALAVGIHPAEGNGTPQGSLRTNWHLRRTRVEMRQVHMAQHRRWIQIGLWAPFPGTQRLTHGEVQTNPHAQEIGELIS